MFERGRRNIKRLLTIILMIAITVTAAGCSGSGTDDPAGANSLKIVTTIFPEYDWVRTIMAGSNTSAEVTMLLESGVDMHSYRPTVDDMLKISTCDLFIYVGGESDSWADKAVAEANNGNMLVIDLMDVLEGHIREEEEVVGMQTGEHDHAEDHDTDSKKDHDHEEDHDHDADNGDRSGHEIEYDEHVWLSVENAAIICEKIEEALETLDPDNKNLYQTNLAAYKKDLEDLRKEYKNTVEGAKLRTILFGDRFPFRYYTDEWGLDYYAAFSGCSAETEASFETIVFLAKKVDELGLPVILKIENSSDSIARTVRDNTASKDQEILTLDSMQSVTAAEVEKGTTYLSIMRSNLEILKKALGIHTGG